MVQYFAQVFKWIFLGVTLFSLFFLFNQFNPSQYFPIKTVRIYGVQHIDRDEIKNLLLPLVSKGFFMVNVTYVKDRLAEIPWAANIFVKRHWPDQLEVTIVEKKAIASWNDEALISDTGEIFLPKNISQEKIPKLFGPLGKQVLMLQMLNDINQILQSLQLSVRVLMLSPMFSWKVILDNGIVLQVGEQDILTRLNHFVKVYAKMIGTHAKDVDYIDLRYANGIAVRWKQDMKFNSK